MKHYTCNVCGEEFDYRDPKCSTTDRPYCAPGELGVAASGEDVCPRCLRVGHSVDFRAAMLDAWRKAVDKTL